MAPPPVLGGLPTLTSGPFFAVTVTLIDAVLPSLAAVMVALPAATALTKAGTGKPTRPRHYWKDQVTGRSIAPPRASWEPR